MSLPLSAAAPFFINNSTMRRPEFASASADGSFFIYALNDRTDRIHRFSSWDNVSPNDNETKSIPSTLSGHREWTGISVDNDGKIYVLGRDTRIIRYDDWDDDTPETMTLTDSEHEGISVNNTEIYLLDGELKRIYRYPDWDEDPEDNAQLNTDINWTGISVDNDGQIYLLNNTDSEIVRFNSWQAAKDGTTPASKRIGGTTLYGLNVVNGVVYIINSSNNEIYRYLSWEDNNRESKSIPDGSWNGLTTSGFGLGAWTGISVHRDEDNRDNIYILDKGENQIVRHNSWQAAKDGTAPDTKDIEDIEIEDAPIKNTPIYFLDHTNEQVVRFYDDNLNGSTLERTELNRENIYIVDNTNNTIKHYESIYTAGDGATTTKSLPSDIETIYTLDDPNNRLLRYASFTDTNPDIKNLNISNRSWRSVAINTNGEIFVLSHSTVGFSHESKTITRYTSWDDNNPVSKSISNGHWEDMSIDGNNIYVLDGGRPFGFVTERRIMRFTGGWNNVTNTVSSSEIKNINDDFSAIGDINVNNGRIYIAENRATTRGIYTYDNWSDTTVTEYKSLRATANRQVGAISVHTDNSGNGNIYVYGIQIDTSAGTSQHYIDKYTSQTDTSPTTRTLDTMISMRTTNIITPLDYSGIGIDDQLRLYVVSNATNKILRLDNLDEDTTPESKIIPNGEWRGISVGQHNAIYLIDNSNNRVAQYSSWEDNEPTYKSNIGQGHWLGIDATRGPLYLLDNGLPGNQGRVVRYNSFDSNVKTENNLIPITAPNIRAWEGISVDNKDRIYVIFLKPRRDLILQYKSWDEWENPSIFYLDRLRTNYGFINNKGVSVTIPRAKNWAGVGVGNSSSDNINDYIYSISDKENRIYRIDTKDNTIESRDIPGDSNELWVGIGVAGSVIYAFDQHNSRVLRINNWDNKRNITRKINILGNSNWWGPSVDGNYVYFINNPLNRIARYSSFSSLSATADPETKSVQSAADYKGISVRGGKIYLIDNDNDNMLIYDNWDDEEPTIRSLPSGGWHGIEVGAEESVTPTRTGNNWAGISVITLRKSAGAGLEDNPVIAIAECDTKIVATYDSWEDTTAYYRSNSIVDQSKHRISLGSSFRGSSNGTLYVLDNANNRILEYGFGRGSDDNIFVTQNISSIMQIDNGDWRGISLDKSRVYVLDNANKRVLCYQFWQTTEPPTIIVPEFTSPFDERRWKIGQWQGLSKLNKYLYSVDNISNTILRFPIRD